MTSGGAAGTAVPTARRAAPAVGLLGWIVTGLLVGIGGAVLVAVGPWPVAIGVHYAAPYVLLLALIGFGAARARAAAMRATGAFTAFVVGYYAVVAAQHGAVPLRYAGAWLLAAVTVCPLAAAALQWATRNRGTVPAALLAAGDATALSDGSLGDIVRQALTGPVADPQPLLAAGDLLVALALVLLLARDARTRRTAAVLLVPFGIAATWAGWLVHFGPGPYL